MSRLNAKGHEIGEAYQQSCIESWQHAGFEPVSVNSINEPCSHSTRIISVSRDASAITGRPHVFLADLLAVGDVRVSRRRMQLPVQQASEKGLLSSSQHKGSSH